MNCFCKTRYPGDPPQRGEGQRNSRPGAADVILAGCACRKVNNPGPAKIPLFEGGNCHCRLGIADCRFLLKIEKRQTSIQNPKSEILALRRSLYLEDDPAFDCPLRGRHKAQGKNNEEESVLSSCLGPYAIIQRSRYPGRTRLSSSCRFSAVE